jgi:nicotinate-nucleotide pyrophosphorylase (carboxylating)
MSIQRKIISPEISHCIERALAEDIGSGDVTTELTVSPDARMAGQIIAKQDGIIAGLEVTESVFRSLDEEISFTSGVAEGARVQSGEVVAELSGKTRALLTAERTALNFLGRMSGIATLTREFVDRVAGTRARILDTRKTAPGLRAIDKLAVTLGGGDNHRRGLYDMVLIKDNHSDQAGSLANAVQRAQRSASAIEIEVEARTIEEVKAALDLGVKRILLDNMSLGMLEEAVVVTAGRAKLEASGNVTLANVRSIATTGVDFISVGALTHSAKVFDVSLNLRSTGMPHQDSSTRAKARTN